jgi:hypothetical protein
MLVFGSSIGTLRDRDPVQVHGGERMYIVGLSVVLPANSAPAHRAWNSRSSGVRSRM